VNPLDEPFPRAVPLLPIFSTSDQSNSASELQAPDCYTFPKSSPELPELSSPVRIDSTGKESDKSRSDPQKGAAGAYFLASTEKADPGHQEGQKAPPLHRIPRTVI